MATDKSRHAFGNSQNLNAALTSGAIDAYDILFLDGDSNPSVGWVDSQGVIRRVDNEKVIMVDGETMPETGVAGKVYIHNEEGFFWNGTEFKPLSKSADLSGLEGKVTTLEEQIVNKVDATTVQNMIEEHADSVVEIVEF